MSIRVFRRLICANPLPYFSETTSNNCTTKSLLFHHYSTFRDRRNDASEDLFLQDFESNYENNNKDNEDEERRRNNSSHHTIPNPIPNRPLRGEKRSDLTEDRFLGKFKLGNDYDADDDEKGKRSPPNLPQNRPMSGGKRDHYHFNNNEFPPRKFGLAGNIDSDVSEEIKRSYQIPPLQSPTHMKQEKRENQLEYSFLEKFKLGVENKEKPQPQSHHITSETETMTEAKAAMPSSPPQDADEIFKKMKETGLIPNAVAMLDALCKDGLVQEAMKLFGLMREKGTIPEVVIYTAVVEGFCKAHKLDDAKRIFRKMQNNGISPNTFSYTVLIQGLYKGRRLDDAIDFCIEMLEAGHSPNVATFAALIDCFCMEKGVGEAEAIIRRLREKGFFIDDKAVREHLDKKGPFSSLVWEAIFGKKSPQKPF